MTGPYLAVDYAGSAEITPERFFDLLALFALLLIQYKPANPAEWWWPDWARVSSGGPNT